MMRQQQLGNLWPVSALTLGGGGLGQLWGETNRAECVATTHAAIEAGITLLDMAPTYGPGEAELVMGEAFAGRLPNGMRITTKCRLGDETVADAPDIITRALDDSLARMRLDWVDLLFLHSNIVPDDYDIASYTTANRPPTRWSTYRDAVIPTFERLRDQGRIGAWGITGIGLPDSIIQAMESEPRPAAVQCIANLLDSPGGTRYYREPARCRETIAAAKANGVGVMGIRAVQAGALTDAVDRPLPPEHPEMLDYAQAAPFRALAAEIGEKPAVLAHRYALAMDGVETVVLGVKNSRELRECLDGEAAGMLDPEIIARIDRAVGQS